jgi:hypothetical protein
LSCNWHCVCFHPPRSLRRESKACWSFISDMF